MLNHPHDTSMGSLSCAVWKFPKLSSPSCLKGARYVIIKAQAVNIVKICFVLYGGFNTLSSLRKLNKSWNIGWNSLFEFILTGSYTPREITKKQNLNLSLDFAYFLRITPLKFPAIDKVFLLVIVIALWYDMHA